MAHTISNSDSVVDSRDVIARIEELESALEDRHNEEVEDSAKTEEERTHGDKPIVTLDFEEWLKEQHDQDDDDATELIALRNVASQGEGYGDWHHGEALIRDSYFEDYARELANDLYGADEKKGWPFDYIDWEAAADALKMDYTEIDWDGVTYYMRA